MTHEHDFTGDPIVTLDGGRLIHEQRCQHVEAQESGTSEHHDEEFVGRETSCDEFRKREWELTKIRTNDWLVRYPDVEGLPKTVSAAYAKLRAGLENYEGKYRVDPMAEEQWFDVSIFSREFEFTFEQIEGGNY